MPRHSRWAGLAVALVVSAACARAPETLPSSSPEKIVGFSILEDYDKGDDLAEVAQDFDLFRQLGVSVWRGSLGWDDYEPERGQYDFSWLYQFAALAHSRGITFGRILPKHRRGRRREAPTRTSGTIRRPASTTGPGSSTRSHRH